MKSKVTFWFFMILTFASMGAVIVAGLAQDQETIANAAAMTSAKSGIAAIPSPAPQNLKGWVLECNWDTNYRRCASKIGLMMMCENGGCLQSHCTNDTDCFLFADAYGMYDSCRTYSCLHGQCVDQFAVSIPNPPVPGEVCTSSEVSSGLCSHRGACEVFGCKEDADCPPYALECGVIYCDLGDRTCKPRKLPNGTPCSAGMCANGTCN